MMEMVYHHGAGTLAANIQLTMLCFRGHGQFMMVLNSPEFWIFSSVFDALSTIAIFQVSQIQSWRCPADKYHLLYHIIIEIAVFRQQFLFIRYARGSCHHKVFWKHFWHWVGIFPACSSCAEKLEHALSSTLMGWIYCVEGYWISLIEINL